MGSAEGGGVPCASGGDESGRATPSDSVMVAGVWTTRPGESVARSDASTRSVRSTHPSESSQRHGFLPRRFLRARALAFSFFAASTFGCSTLAGGPRGFSVEETSFGLYERDGERWRLVEQTASVPCRAGVAFGLQAELVSLADRETRLPVQGEKFEAAAPGAKETRVVFLTEVMVAPVGEARRSIDAIWTLEAPSGGGLFDHPVLIRLFDPASYHTYLEHTFEIVGCGPADVDSSAKAESNAKADPSAEAGPDASAGAGAALMSLRGTPART